MQNEIIRTEQPKSWLQPSNIEEAVVLADRLSKSKLVPATFQGKPEDCLMAIVIAQEKGIGLWDVFQNGFIIKGKFGWDTKFVVANINASNRIKGGLKFRKETKTQIEIGGKNVPNMEYTAYAIDAATGEELLGPTVSVKNAIDAGWWSTNPLWQNDTENMLWQRAAKRWGNMYGVGVGGNDREELRDQGEIQDAVVIEPVQAAPASPAASASSKKRPAAQPATAPPATAPQMTIYPAAETVPVDTQQPRQITLGGLPVLWHADGTVTDHSGTILEDQDFQEFDNGGKWQGGAEVFNGKLQPINPVLE